MIIKRASFTPKLVGVIPKKLLNIELDLKGLNKDSFTCKSEILLMTNSTKDNFDDLINWIYYHKYIINISQITIVHNNCNDEESKKILRKICDTFNIKYYYETEGNQEFIFNKYQPMSTAEWLICIDEDEYIYLNGESLDSILEKYENEYKLSLCMINFYSEKLIKDKNNTPWPILFDCYDPTMNSINCESKYYPTSTFFKTFVNNKYKHYLYNDKNNNMVYIDLNKPFIKNSLNRIMPRKTDNFCNISVVHNPMTIVDNSIKPSYNISLNNYTYACDICKSFNIIEQNINYFIAHFKYRTKEEHVKKCLYNKFKDVLDNYYKTYENDVIDDIYNHGSFIKYNKLKDAFSPYIDEINKIKSSIL